MDKMIDLLRHPKVLPVDAQLLILYCVSVALFFAFDGAARSAAGTMKDGVRAGKAPQALAAFALAGAANALAAAALVFLCGKLGVVPRLAMVALPLLLLLEKHGRAARADKDRRRLELLLAAGALAGIVGAALTLLRGAPLK
jgi:predicted metal-binding membrane protein